MGNSDNLIAEQEISAHESYYDYIIIGCGCAGLSLAMHIINADELKEKKVLMLDRLEKNTNDRTWCFWEIEKGFFEPIVFKKWDILSFSTAASSIKLQIAPYSYKMIRGLDYYKYCLQIISEHPNFSIQYGSVDNVFSSADSTGIITGGKVIYSSFVFNSALTSKPALTHKQYWLLQHFKGWIIETEQDFFDMAGATLMDFNTNQRRGTSFCYVLPFSPRKALIEYTIFSKDLISQDEYDSELKSYIHSVLKIESYTVAETEFGIIPMTNFKFATREQNIINIGTAGGQTKGSSGYTFNFIQKHSNSIVHALIHGNPIRERKFSKYAFYDSILLSVLSNNTLSGEVVFKHLFEKNEARKVFKFLDNETTLVEDIQIIRTLPFIPFLKAAIRQIF